MGQLPLRTGSFGPYISIPQGNNKSNNGVTYRILNPDKFLLFFLWNEASIGGHFFAHPELHTGFDVMAIQGFPEEQQSVAITSWSELCVGLSISADWDHGFDFSYGIIPLARVYLFENRARGDF